MGVVNPAENAAEPAADGAAVEITGLTYAYPVGDAPALRRVDLRVEPGSLCAIIGPNGAGKTTLCHAIRGFVPQFYKGELTGTVRVGDIDIADADENSLARHVGYLFENPFTQMSGITDTVFDELAFGLANLGVPAPEIRSRVSERLDEAGLTDLAVRNPFHLSGGQQQRVALASVLIMDQPVLVIDEPTSQLDPRSTEEVFDIIARARDAGRTVVLVEHKLGLVAEHADQVVVLDGGEVVVDGPPAAVFGDARTTAHGADLPPAARLAAGLRARGFDVGTHLSVEALADALRAAVGRDPDPRDHDDRPEHAGPPEGPLPPVPGAPDARGAGEPLIELDDVSYTYPSGTRAVDGVSLAVGAGESVAIVGLNGAGKTTTVKTMNALVRPTSGSVRIAGVDTAGSTTAQVSRRIGYVFQNPDDQIFHTTVRAEVDYGLKRMKLPEEERARRVQEAAELTGLADALEENPHDLPLSVRKFVTIACVLAADPDAVVLDEPTAGQDRAGLDRLADLLAHLAERGRTVVTITHDMEFVAEHVDRVVVMARGRIVADGQASDIFTDDEAMSAARLAPPAIVELAGRLGLGHAADLGTFVAALRRRAGRP
ncbi:hypothetical protein GCM10023169_15860 [Georgenia halophila]|uniref:ABC transporter domain-containing protein n=1 Tax=Georgenia halophila TaxID=620889 RepID=A0ABP8L3H6_9MICO